MIVLNTTWTEVEIITKDDIRTRDNQATNELIMLFKFHGNTQYNIFTEFPLYRYYKSIDII